MADKFANIMLGRWVYYAGLPAASDALVWIVLNATGLQATTTIVDYDDVAAMLAASNDEHATMGRKTTTSTTIVVDDTNDRTDVDTPDQTWTAATGASTGQLCLAYDPDSTGGTDSDLVPMAYFDFAVTLNGSDITAQVASLGFGRAA